MRRRTRTRITILFVRDDFVVDDGTEEEENIWPNIVLLNPFHISHPIYLDQHGLGSPIPQFSFIFKLVPPTKISRL